MQGGALGAARGILSPYAAAPRERTNAPPAAVTAASRGAGPFSAACSWFPAPCGGTALGHGGPRLKSAEGEAIMPGRLPQSRAEGRAE